MPPRKKTNFTQENVDHQLQQIHLLDESSSTENLEQLGPIIKQIHASRQQEAFLRTVQSLVQSKEEEIEKICGDNYQDFVSSVSTLLTVRSYTVNLRDKILSLDSSVGSVGHGLAAKKKALLKSKMTAANLDEAIDTLQACLTVLDLVHRIGELIKETRYWSALRSLEDIQSLPPSSLSQTPFFTHLLSSLPSLRTQIKDAVTASTNSWLLEIRNISGEVGRLALEAMETRTRRWRSRREKVPLLKLSRVGSSVEMVTNETIEYDVLDNDKLKVDFKPLYQCIQIYTALDSLEELQRSYQADRKAQSTLILPTPLSLSSLPTLIQEIVGFFIVESHVLRTTMGFRSEREVDELWENVVGRVEEGMGQTLANETDPEVFLDVKESLIAFSATLEGYSYSTQQLHSLLMVLFEKYGALLEKQYNKRFDNIVLQDDQLPMRVEGSSDRDAVIASVWLSDTETAEIKQTSLPMNLPWSQTFYLCCQDIHNFVNKYYQFVEGVAQYQRDIDELLGKAVDRLLTAHISTRIAERLASISGLSQIALVVSNLEHFEIACAELERKVTSIRSSHRGGTLHLSATASFSKTLTRATARISAVISSKLDDFFELAEYEWTPNSREDMPSMYLYELVNWLTTVVDSLVVKEAYKNEAYKGAVTHVSECLLDFLTGRNVLAINENAISNLLVDVDFLDQELKRIGRPNLSEAFGELRSLCSIPLSDTVQNYLVPSTRLASYSGVKPKKLAALLDKMAKAGLSSRDPVQREQGSKRQKEAEAVGRLFPGENR
ncbi:exocyst complex subunit Sec15-like-domain-containing protein [Gautieria morchelliformis]|nr:exocyst complex subunit Sec15-like-domain-containing protein [Gautieria morchelliformis]